MPESLLVLRLEGPLQSWGERARWDQRDSLREPTKSGIVGLLGCALGIRRQNVQELQTLDRTLRMGVRVDREGTALDDYHTVSGLLPTAEEKWRDTTIVSQRRYLEDASFLAVLAHRQRRDRSLQRCADALRDPHWPLYLGRRSCVPTRPVLVELCDRYDTIEEAIARYPWSCLGADGVRRSRLTEPEEAPRLRVVIDDETGALTRQDVIEVNEARLYNRRRVREYWTARPQEEVVA